MKSTKLISVIVPVYNEELNIPILYKEIVNNTSTLLYNFELIFVDDGSTDNSDNVIKSLPKSHIKNRLISLSRNFGKEATVSAGLHASKGNAAIILDADLQMPPSIIGEFISSWESGAEVVVGIFASRSMSRFRRWGAHIFYSVMQRISHTEITPHATDYRLLDRQVIDQFNKLSEHNRMTRGLIDWLGFKRSYVHFDQRPRENGDPNYSYKKLFNLAMNSFTAYSLLPLRMAGYLGVAILIFSVPLGIFLTIMRFVLHNPYHWSLTGTTLLAVLILFLVGMILACLGLIAMYIAHIHAEVINRPLYVIRDEQETSAEPGLEEI